MIRRSIASIGSDGPQRTLARGLRGSKGFRWEMTCLSRGRRMASRARWRRRVNLGASTRII